MPTFNKAQDVLNFWESVHGELDAKWRSVFLSDKTVKEIIKHKNDRIAVAIRRNTKLVDILEDLFKQEDRHHEFLLSQNPYFESIPDEPGRGDVEKREIQSNRFGRRF